MKYVASARWWLLGISLLAGCATTRHYEDSLRTWEGKTGKSLIQRWGEPTQVVQLADGGKMYLYYRRNAEMIRVKKEMSREVSGVNSTEPLYDCKTQMLVNRNDIVVSWKYEGHDCRR